MPTKEAAAPAAETATAAAAAAPEPEAPAKLSDLVAPLALIPKDERAAGASSLLEFSDLMQRVQVGLLTRNPETEELVDQDR